VEVRENEEYSENGADGEDNRADWGAPAGGFVNFTTSVAAECREGREAPAEDVGTTKSDKFPVRGDADI